MTSWRKYSMRKEPLRETLGLLPPPPLDRPSPRGWRAMIQAGKHLENNRNNRLGLAPSRGIGLVALGC